MNKSAKTQSSFNGATSFQKWIDEQAIEVVFSVGVGFNGATSFQKWIVCNTSGPQDEYHRVSMEPLLFRNG